MHHVYIHTNGCEPMKNYRAELNTSKISVRRKKHLPFLFPKPEMTNSKNKH